MRLLGFLWGKGWKSELEGPTNWTDWRPLSDARSKGGLIAPAGPGVVDFKLMTTGEPIFFGLSARVAAFIEFLLFDEFRSGDDAEIVFLRTHKRHLMYRTMHHQSVADAIDFARGVSLISYRFQNYELFVRE